MTNNTTLGFYKTLPSAIIPTKAHAGDLGWDLYAPYDFTIDPLEKFANRIDTGIAIQFPSMIGGLIRDRSSVSSQRLIFVVGGVIDSGYRGSLIVTFISANTFPHTFKAGDKIAQLVLIPVLDITAKEISLDEFNATQTSRGLSGFGSSGT